MRSRALIRAAIWCVLAWTAGCSWFGRGEAALPVPAAPAAAEAGTEGGAEGAEKEEVLGEADLYVYEPDVKEFEYGNLPVIRIDTPDGWRLALYHYVPPGALAKEFPVLLVHGEGFNRYIWDFDEKHSLARYLSEQIFDTWVIELRGHGHSRPEEAAPGPGAAWTFEDYATDVWAAINYILGQTGAAQINLVGHSTGGTLVYGLMENDPYAQKIAAGLTLSAPTLFRTPNDTLTALFLHREEVYGEDFLDLRLGGYLPAPFPENTQTVYGVLFFNDFFLDPELTERFTDMGFEKVPVPILRQFSNWFAEEKAFAAAGERTFNYNDDLSVIRSPLCAFVGWRDNIAQPENTLDSLANVEPSLLTLELFGKVNGHQDNYGHLGLLLNDYAHVDVYPKVADCFDRAALRAEESIYQGPGMSGPQEPAQEPSGQEPAAPAEPVEPSPAAPAESESPARPGEPPAAPAPEAPPAPQFQQPEYLPAEPVEPAPEAPAQPAPSFEQTP